MRKDQSTGFTLIELLVAMTVMVLLITMGVPSLSRLQQQNQLTSGVYQIRDAMHYGRAEAVNRQRTVIICPGDFINGCAANWGASLIAYINLDGVAGFQTGGDQMLKAFNLPGNLQIKAKKITELELYKAGRASGGTLTLSTSGFNEGIEVVITPGGRIRTEKVAVCVHYSSNYSDDSCSAASGSATGAGET